MPRRLPAVRQLTAAQSLVARALRAAVCADRATQLACTRKACILSRARNSVVRGSRDGHDAAARPFDGSQRSPGPSRFAAIGVPFASAKAGATGNAEARGRQGEPDELSQTVGVLFAPRFQM